MKLWKWIPELLSQETVKSGAEGTKQIFELAKILKEQKTDVNIAPLVGSISSLLDILNSPLGQVCGVAAPLLPLATGIISFIIKTTKKEPDLSECIALVCQAAYLESFRKLQFIPDEERKKILDRFNNANSSKDVADRIEAIGDKLELDGSEIIFEEEDAKKTLFCFHQSKLARIFNDILSKRLVESGLSELGAIILTERISRYTHRYFKKVVVDLKDKVPALYALYGSGWENDEKKYQSIDAYLEEVIKENPRKKVFDEDFTFQDIYVSLKVKYVKEENPDKLLDKNIKEWAKELLNDPKKDSQVIFIQAAPGRGKSVFCRMFADRVRLELYPIYIPIFIRLRDLKSLGDNCDETLSSIIGREFANSNWLTDKNSQFLFILDGFDELLLERGINDGLDKFLKQVASFQELCAQNPSERGHRVLITGRPLALLDIERDMPTNLERVEIQIMEPLIQKEWLNKWSKVADLNPIVANEKAKEFASFLADSKCPQEVKILAREPLLIYLLAAMYRDNIINASMFQTGSSDRAKIIIYEKTLEWVLTKQRTKVLNKNITKLDEDHLEIILTEAALCVVQSSQEYIPISMILERLKGSEVHKILDTQKTTIETALATFYIKSTQGRNNHVEFLHKSFSEFLFAKRIFESCCEWRKITSNRRYPYQINDENLHKEIHDLFGYGSLTYEVVGYIKTLWETEKHEDLVKLFERLYDFHLSWYKGEFIEKTSETLSQKKALELQNQKIKSGQRTVDIYTGLNVLILLLEIYRCVKNKFHQTNDKSLSIEFNLCGEPNTPDFDIAKLLNIINYCNGLSNVSFCQSLGKFLVSLNLNDVDLHGADIRGVNLRDAYLDRSNLRGANLSSSELSGANLSNADLHGTDLSNANLHGAYLGSANLHGANLHGADLSSANFSNANLCGADLCNANLCGATLIDTNLWGANLCGANLSGADIRGADLYKIEWNSSTTFQYTFNRDLAINIPEIFSSTSISQSDEPHSFL